MDTKLMTQTALAMVAPGKGSLAADESAGTCKKRFDSVNVECTEESRRTYREMLFTTPGIEEFVSGVILFDETLRQKTKEGEPFAEYMKRRGVIPGIKVDGGVHDMALHPGEKVSDGLDGLRKRLEEYFKLGARFAKWRAVITIGDTIPSRACIQANAHALARYSALCQEASIVPIVEPEVLLDGNHTVERCESVSEATLATLFAALHKQDCSLEHVVLKASMVVSGKENARQAGVAEVAERTLKVLKRTVPAALPGVVFLSGGQSDEAATAHLDAMNRIGAPWPLTFSYSRALQAIALKTWRGSAGNFGAAQKAFHHRARMNSLAALGKWNAELEKKSRVTPMVFETSIASLPLLGRGKVRDIYAVGDDKLLIVTTDRLSAFDVILPTPIPEKGRVLTELANFWFAKLAGIIPNQLTGIDPESVVTPEEREQVRGRSIVVRKLAPLPVEAVARGYLEGSGWKEYQESQSVCGIALPPGLKRASKLPQPIFTPATKAEAGHHDENISFERMAKMIGAERAAQVRDVTLELYKAAADYALTKGIIIADTKFEFGVDKDGSLVLIDEALTPDSSRFWPLATWKEGESPESFDKQYIRNWLDSIGFARKAPAPPVPRDVALKTSEKYQEALRRLAA